MAWSLLDPVTASIEKALDLRSRQHALVVTNLANSDTPGFKARKLDFHRSMARLQRGDAGMPTRTHTAHLGGESDSDAALVVQMVEPSAWAGDGNSVDPQREMAVLTENQMLYNASIEVINRRIGLLRYVVGEGK